MRGHQSSFFLLPEDLEVFEKAARRRGPLVAFEYRLHDPRVSPLENFAVPKMGESALTIYLARPEDVPSLRFRHVEPNSGPAFWCVDELRSPVVELSRCYWDKKILRRGRLYFKTGFFDEKDDSTEKSEAFVKWAKSLLTIPRRTKPFARLEAGVVVGPAALGWRQSGGRFVMF